MSDAARLALFLIGVLALTAMAMGCKPKPRASIEANFDSGDEGWALVEDGSDTLTTCSVGGNPGGHLCESDSQGSVPFGFSASASFVGNQSNMIGGSLSWEWLATGQVPDLVASGLLLAGAGLELEANVGTPTITGWSGVVVPLAAQTFQCVVGCAGTPSAADFSLVMNDVTEIVIRGDWVFGTGSKDTTRLDNVLMESKSASAGAFVVDASTSGGGGAILGFDPAQSTAPITIESMFEINTEGWGLENNAGLSPDHSSSGGSSSTGFLSSYDNQGGTAFRFLAPPVFLGNQAAMIGGTLTWDWKALAGDNDRDDFGSAALYLEGGGIRIEAAVGQPTTADWSSESVALIPQSFSCDSGCAKNRTPPTFVEFRNVMTQLSRVAIQGDWVYGVGFVVDRTGIDNVRMQSAGTARPIWTVASPAELRDPSGIAWETADAYLVSDPNPAGGSAAIFRIAGGTATPIASGGLLVNPLGLALGAGYLLYVADPNSQGVGGVVQIDTRTGVQTQISSGGLFDTPIGIALDANGDLLVADREAFGGTGAVIRVNPGSGQQSVVSSGGAFVDPSGLAVDAQGDIWVADPNAAQRRGALIRVDPATGQQTVVSRGQHFVDPVDVAVEASGDLLVVDQGAASALAGNGAILRVNAVDGLQTRLVSGFPLLDPMAISLKNAAGP